LKKFSKFFFWFFRFEMTFYTKSSIFNHEKPFVCINFTFFQSSYNLLISSRFDDIFKFWKTPLWSNLARIFLETDVKVIFNHKNRILERITLIYCQFLAQTGSGTMRDAQRHDEKWRFLPSSRICVTHCMRHALSVNPGPPAGRPSCYLVSFHRGDPMKKS
jgi:hypothetical protein